MDDDLAKILNEPPSPTAPYVYRGTKTHINKFGILNPDALERVVRAITALRAELLVQNPIKGNYDLEHLCAIHRYLFQDIYHWAGELRVINFDPNRSIHPFLQRRLGSQRPHHLVENPEGPPFTPADGIVKEVNELLSKLSEDHYLMGLDLTAFAERLAFYLTSLFNIHPFRDGNGRTIRAFLRQLANKAGWQFDLDSVPQIDRHLTAFLAHCGDLEPLRNVVRQSVSLLQNRGS